MQHIISVIEQHGLLIVPGIGAVNAMVGAF